MCVAVTGGVLLVDLTFITYCYLKSVLYGNKLTQRHLELLQVLIYLKRTQNEQPNCNITFS